MPRVCEICQSSLRTEIDALLVRSVSYRRISGDFTFTERQLSNHHKSHIQPLIQTANNAIQASVTSQMLEYHTEVSLPLIERSAKVYKRLVNKLDEAGNLNEYLAVHKELRGWFEQEAKLSGAYTNPKDNPETISKAIENYRSYASRFPDDSPAEVAEAIQAIASGADVDPKILSAKIQAQAISDLEQ